jgi:hypothetical protein
MFIAISLYKYSAEDPFYCKKDLYVRVYDTTNCEVLNDFVNRSSAVWLTTSCGLDGPLFESL